MPARLESRILWAAGDLVENRPALSRWHPDYKDAFEAFMKAPVRNLPSGYDKKLKKDSPY
jgi:hypothetical protein